MRAPSDLQRGQRPLTRRTLIQGVRGLRNVICLSAVLSTLGEVEGLERVRRVNVAQGEIEVEGAPAAEAIHRALVDASDLLAGLGADSPADVLPEGLCDPAAARAVRVTVLPA